MHLVAIMGWHCCKIKYSRVSNTMEPAFCVDVLEQALR
jgi:hypothetical protein